MSPLSMYGCIRFTICTNKGKKQNEIMERLESRLKRGLNKRTLDQSKDLRTNSSSYSALCLKESERLRDAARTVTFFSIDIAIEKTTPLRPFTLLLRLFIDSIDLLSTATSSEARLILQTSLSLSGEVKCLPNEVYRMPCNTGARCTFSIS